MEIKFLDCLYNLYLMLVGGYIILLIGVIGYLIGLHKLYKQQEAFEEKVQQDVMDKINNL